MADQVPTTSETTADISNLERDLLANYGRGELLNNSVPAAWPTEETFEWWDAENAAIVARIEALPVSTPGALRLKALAVATINGMYREAAPANETPDVRLSRQIVETLALAPAVGVAA